MILGLSGKSKVLLCMQIPQVVYNGIIIISIILLYNLSLQTHFIPILAGWGADKHTIFGHYVLCMSESITLNLLDFFFFSSFIKIIFTKA